MVCGGYSIPEDTKIFSLASERRIYTAVDLTPGMMYQFILKLDCLHFHQN